MNDLKMLPMTKTKALVLSQDVEVVLSLTKYNTALEHSIKITLQLNSIFNFLFCSCGCESLKTQLILHKNNNYKDFVTSCSSSLLIDDFILMLIYSISNLSLNITCNIVLYLNILCLLDLCLNDHSLSFTII